MAPAGSLPETKYKGLRRGAPMKRTGFKPKLRGVPEPHDRAVAEWKKQAIAAFRSPHTDKGTANWRIAGKPWPFSYVPEEHNKNYETCFREMVEIEAAREGWETSHNHLPYFDTAGIPDLTFVHPARHRLFYAELKVRDLSGDWKTPTPAQSRWLAWISFAGIRAYVWLWPDSWDEILEELAA